MRDESIALVIRRGRPKNSRWPDTRDRQILEHRRTGLPALASQQPMRPRPIQHTRRFTGLIQQTTQRDRLAERVDLLALEVRLGRQLDHVAITRRADRGIDGRVVTPARTHGDRLG